MSVEQPERGKCQQSQRGLPLILQRTRTRNLMQRAHVLYMHAQRRGTSVVLYLHAEMHHFFQFAFVRSCVGDYEEW